VKEIVVLSGKGGTGKTSLTAALALVAGKELVVAEPTVSSLHDLRRLYDVIRGFGIPIGAVINKSDLNPQVADELKSFFRDHAIDLLTTIPYDEQISGALSEGKTMAEINPHYFASIGKIWWNLCKIL